MAWVCSASVHDSSASTTLEATWRLSPTPAAVSEQTTTATSGSLTKASMFFCARRGGLVAADRGVAEPALGEGLLGDVHHVDVLGEEDDLADAAGELRGVVGGQPGLGLADPAHHAEDVLAGLRRGRVLALPGRDPAYQVVVDAVDDDAGRCASRARCRSAPPAGGRAPARPRGSSGRPRRRARPAGRRRDGPGCRRRRRPCDAARCPGRSRWCGRRSRTPESAGVSPVSSSASISSARGFFSSIQPRNCQIARKSSMSLISGVPVRAISSGPADAAPGSARRAAARAGSAARTCS